MEFIPSFLVVNDEEVWLFDVCALHWVNTVLVSIETKGVVWRILTEADWTNRSIDSSNLESNLFVQVVKRAITFELHIQFSVYTRRDRRDVCMPMSTFFDHLSCVAPYHFNHTLWMKWQFLCESKCVPSMRMRMREPVYTHAVCVCVSFSANSSFSIWMYFIFYLSFVLYEVLFAWIWHRNVSYTLYVHTNTFYIVNCEETGVARWGVRNRSGRFTCRYVWIDICGVVAFSPSSSSSLLIPNLTSIWLALIHCIVSLWFGKSSTDLWLLI